MKSLLEKVQEKFAGVPVEIQDIGIGVGITKIVKDEPSASGVITDERSLEIFYRVFTAQGE